MRRGRNTQTRCRLHKSGLKPSVARVHAGGPWPIRPASIHLTPSGEVFTRMAPCVGPCCPVPTATNCPPISITEGSWICTSPVICGCGSAALRGDPRRSASASPSVGRAFLAKPALRRRREARVSRRPSNTVRLPREGLNDRTVFNPRTASPRACCILVQPTALAHSPPHSPSRDGRPSGRPMWGRAGVGVARTKEIIACAADPLSRRTARPPPLSLHEE